MKGKFVLISFLASMLLVSTAGTNGAPGAHPAVAESEAKSAGGQAQPEATCPSGGQCFADVPSTNPFYDFANRIYQQDLVSGYACGGLGEPCDAENRPYYRPGAGVTRQQMAKFIDNARRLPEIHLDVDSGPAPLYVRNGAGQAISAQSTSGDAVYAQSTSAAGVVGISSSNVGIYGGSTGATGVFGVSESAYGVKGTSNSSTGVLGVSTSGIGVNGYSSSSYGVKGTSDTSTGVGVYGVSSNGTGVVGSGGDKGVSGISVSGIGVYGFALAAQGGKAGYFLGNVEVTGACCSAAAGTFKIDHPLDPTNRYLYHAAVESPDMLNVYSGNVTTDSKGEAVVMLPNYFEALNRDFRYQLTVIGQFAQAIVSSEIGQNVFTIKTDKPNVRVSWQVTGIRQDPYANAHRIQVEEVKGTDEQGKYLHPTEWGQPESMGVGYELPKPDESR